MSHNFVINRQTCKCISNYSLAHWQTKRNIQPFGDHSSALLDIAYKYVALSFLSLSLSRYLFQSLFLVLSLSFSVSIYSTLLLLSLDLFSISLPRSLSLSLLFPRHSITLCLSISFSLSLSIYLSSSLLSLFLVILFFFTSVLYVAYKEACVVSGWGDTIIGDTTPSHHYHSSRQPNTLAW